uniref:Uncharacterized protein n=1 Tax=Aegilops tauschii TaxID=37682 RepID=M8B9J0_AEGTA
MANLPWQTFNMCKNMEKGRAQLVGGMLEVCSGRERRWRARFDAHEGLQLGAAAAATAPPAELFNAAAGAYLNDDDARASAKGKTDVQYIILDRVMQQPSTASSGGACWMSSRRPWSGGAFREIFSSGEHIKLPSVFLTYQIDVGTVCIGNVN